MILILTPLKLEFDGLSAALGAPSRREDLKQSSLFYYGEDLVLGIGGHGKTQFGVTTSYLISLLNPRLVVCAGASGALVPWLKPLDLVAAAQTVEHDFNLRFVKRPIPSFPGASEPLEQLRSVEGVHVGSVASGDEDIMDPSRAEIIREKTNAIAVAWEGAGGARACAFHEVPFLELRVITDHCSTTSFQDFKKHLETGMARIGSMVDLIKRSRLSQPVRD